jgi:hypothetical protein
VLSLQYQFFPLATNDTRRMARSGNNKRKRRASASKRDQRVEAELQEVNAILQDDDRSQQETWQIGKRLKKHMEEPPNMSKRQTLDSFFLWGTALARLASQNEDATLAEAAADKFQEVHEQSNGDDAAMGAVGYSLWASSLLIMALESQKKEVLDEALEKFQVRRPSVRSMVKSGRTERAVDATAASRGCGWRHYV